MTSMRRKAQSGIGGFSLIELLVVIAIIGITVGTALPVIGNYLRMYTIRGARTSVAGEIQAGRVQGIKRNANNGVAFFACNSPCTLPAGLTCPANASCYMYFGEDAPGLTTAPSGLPPNSRRNLAQSVQDGLAGTLRSLPTGYQFQVGGAGNGFCFDRLGMRRDFGTPQCPTVADVPAGNFLVAAPAPNAPGDVQLVVIQMNNANITLPIVIGTGGRVSQP
jgi:prepilin-type N-terminal cleavage/methylation domain-containing protein